MKRILFSTLIVAALALPSFANDAKPAEKAGNAMEAGKEEAKPEAKKKEHKHHKKGHKHENKDMKDMDKDMKKEGNVETPTNN